MKISNKEELKEAYDSILEYLKEKHKAAYVILRDTWDKVHKLFD